jgi:hypothetical protein
MTTASLASTVNLYSPVAAHHNSSAISTLVVAVIIIGFVLLVAGAASFGRRAPQGED